MRRRSFPFGLLLLPILTSFILQSNALVSSFTVSSSGLVNYNPTPKDGWLHTDGIYVKDAQGRIVAVRVITADANPSTVGWRFPLGNTEFITNAKNHGVYFLMLHLRPPQTVGNLDFTLFDYSADIADLDSVVNFAKQNNVYIILNYLQSTTALRNSYGIGDDGVSEVVTHLISFWTPLIDHYKNESTVVGVRLLDEPNIGRVNEQTLWRDTIGNLRQINPNLLWFTHVISELRMGTGYWHLMPWQTPEEVPYPNIIMDGGMWISPNHPEADFGPGDYAGADEVFDRVIADMANFRDNVGIPTGLTPGIDDYYPTNNARGYLLTKLNRWMETNRYIMTLYEAEYKLPIDNGLAMLNEVFPDTPYPYYWDATTEPPIPPTNGESPTNGNETLPPPIELPPIELPKSEDIISNGLYLIGGALIMIVVFSSKRKRR